MNPDGPIDPQPDLLQPRPALVTPPANFTAQLEDLQQQAQDLRTLFNATFVALILMALGLNFFLGKQMFMTRNQVIEQRAQMQRADEAFRTVRDPEFKRVIAGLYQYALAHPDYATVLMRYRAALPQYFPATGVLSGRPDPGALVTPPAPVRPPAGK